MFKIYLDMIKQIFVLLKKEKYTGDAVFIVNFNQGGARSMKTFKQEELK